MLLKSSLPSHVEISNNSSSDSFYPAGINNSRLVIKEYYTTKALVNSHKYDIQFYVVQDGICPVNIC